MISINWGTRVISIPKADTTLIQLTPFEIRELDLNAFRLALKDLEDSENGMAFPYTHNHNPPVSVGGVTLARVIELVNDYTVTFENGNYAVNLVGGNSNVADKVNLNTVSVRAANSAGLVHSREIEELHKLQGLKSGSPMTVTPTSRTVDTITQTISTSGSDVTVTRS